MFYQVLAWWRLWRVTCCYKSYRK